MLWKLGLFVSAFISTVISDPLEQRLLENLFANYTPLERPVRDHREPLVVYLKFTLQQLIDIDEKNQIMKTNGWMDMQWNNYRLIWSPESYNNLTKIRVPYEHVWAPDLLMYNSASDDFDTFVHTHITIDNNGNNLYVPPGLTNVEFRYQLQGIFESTCKIDVSNFPFDEQKCKLKFGIWTFTGERVDLQVQTGGGTDISEYLENGEWQLVDISAKRNEELYDCCPGKFVDITFTVVLARRSMFYIINLVLPCILNSLLTLLTFILPAQAGEKITLSITVLLAQIVFMLLVMETMPATADAIPLISKYFSFSLLCVCASVCATVMVLSFHYCVPETYGPMSPKMRKIFLHLIPKILRQKTYKNDQYLYVTNPVSRLKCLCNSEILQDRYEDVKSSAAQSASCRDIRLLQSLHRHLRYIAHKLSCEEKWEYARLEWQFAARVLDKLFLWFFTILVFIATMSMLFAVPSINRAFS